MLWCLWITTISSSLLALLFFVAYRKARREAAEARREADAAVRALRYWRARAASTGPVYVTDDFAALGIGDATGKGLS